MAVLGSSSLLKLFLVASLIQVSLGSSRFFQVSLATRRLSELVQDQTQLLKYHNGPLLSGKIAINLIWYGNFKPSQKAIISDFITSLSSSSPSKTTPPSVATWWKTTEKYYHLSSNKKTSLSLSLGRQILDEKYSLGKSLTTKQIVQLASKGDQKNAINVVLTSADVAVDGFCMNRCGTHHYKEKPFWRPPRLVAKRLYFVAKTIWRRNIFVAIMVAETSWLKVPADEN